MDKFQPGIVLCSRLHSSRIKDKPLVDINGKTALRRLLENLKCSVYPVCLAIPDTHEDQPLVNEIWGLDVSLYKGNRNNVLARFVFAAIANNFDPIVRVTHDDLFCDVEEMQIMVEKLKKEKADYIYMKGGLRGTDCEVITLDYAMKVLGEYRHRETIEHLSYAFRDPKLNGKIFYHEPQGRKNIKGRISLDWPRDIEPIRFAERNIESSGQDIYEVVNVFPSTLEQTRLPEVTIYTCVYNDQENIERCMESVFNQTFKDFEYIVVNDGSTDESSKIIIRKEFCGNKFKIINLGKNVGLVDASIEALKHAKGKYYIRADSDDYLMPGALDYLVHKMRENENIGAIYPAYNRDGIDYPNTEHHLGGAMVRAWVHHEVGFYAGLRYLEGKEFFLRLSKHHEYLEDHTPTWIYNKRENSLSSHTTTWSMRGKIARMIGGSSISG